MYNNNTPYISYSYKKQDYLDLELTINSDAAQFDAAINIFIDRIQSRFLEQIRTLASNCKRNGFAIMALECLLVETFAQFYEGLNDTVRVSREKYVKFLIYQLHCFPSRNAAEQFYSGIRCGILHQAQTKPNSGLTYGEPRAIEWNDLFLMVSVDRFVGEMEDYFVDYCRRLRDPNEETLRTNFIKKMDFICGHL